MIILIYFNHGPYPPALALFATQDAREAFEAANSDTFPWTEEVSLENYGMFFASLGTIVHSRFLALTAELVC